MTEFRTFHDIEVRAEGDVPGVTLQAIKPGVVDDYGSLWRANAFDESLSLRMPVLCWGHDWSNPLGPAVSFETGRGGPKVHFNFSDFDAVPQARRAHAQVSDGTIRDCSVGFSGTQRRGPSEEERTKYPGIKEVIERATLDEISLVLRGAVPGAKVLSVRGARGKIDIDTAVALGMKVQAGEITLEQAQATAALLMVPDESMVPPEDEEPEEDPLPAALDHDVLDAEIQATLAALP